MGRTDLSDLAALVDWEKVAAEVVKKRAELSAKENVSRKETDVKHLFRVFVVDPKTDEILVDGQSVIAKSEETSKFFVLRDLDRDPDELVVRSTALFSIPSHQDEG